MTIWTQADYEAKLAQVPLGPIVGVERGALVTDADAAGYARATADIVAWLRGLERLNRTTGKYEHAITLQVTADAIERGDFRKVTA